MRRECAADALLLIAPPRWLFLALLFLVPLVQTIALAFQTTRAFGLGNFSKSCNDLDFVTAVKNTFELVIWSCHCSWPLALGMAMMLRQISVGRDIVLWIWRSRSASPISPPDWSGSRS